MFSMLNFTSLEKKSDRLFFESDLGEVSEGWTTGGFKAKEKTGNFCNEFSQFMSGFKASMFILWSMISCNKADGGVMFFNNRLRPVEQHLFGYF